MDRQRVAYNGKQTRQEIIAPEGSHVPKWNRQFACVKSLADTSIWMQC